MATAALQKFDCLTADIMHAVHDFSSHTLKLALSNTSPVVANSILSEIGEIQNGGGYLAGGFTLTRVSSSQTNGAYKLVLQDYSFTASSAVAPFRFAVLYNSSTTNNRLIGWYNYGATVGLQAGENYLFDFNQTTGVFSL